MIVMMSLSQFYTQRQLMQKNVDLSVKTPFMQQQKMLMYIFPDLRLHGHQLPRRCSRLLADHERVDHGPADVRDQPEPDAGQQGPGPVPDPPAEARQLARHAKGRGKKRSSRRSWPRARTATTTSASSSPG